MARKQRARFHTGRDSRFNRQRRIINRGGDLQFFMEGERKAIR